MVTDRTANPGDSLPVIALNRAVAVSMADGPAAGLVLIEQIEHTGAPSG
jgi:predicted RNA polymerase sigma factor